MPIIHYKKEEIKPCPQCNTVLVVEPYESRFTIICRLHGLEMSGYTPEMAVHNWNIAVSWIIRQAADDAADHHEAPAEHSYCCYCERKTKSIVGVNTIGDYEVECGECHLKKYRKEATRANRLFK